MKFLVVISCLVAFSWASQTDDFLDTMRNKLVKSGKACKEEVGASDEDTGLIQGRDVPATKAAKCYIFCISKYVDFMKPDGGINEGNIFKLIDEVKEFDEDLATKFKGITETCLKEVKISSDPCETAYDGTKCYRKEQKARGLPDFEW